VGGRRERTPFRTTLGLVGGGLVLTLLGVLWGEAAPPALLFPINKNLWSPSFVLLTGGLASAGLGVPRPALARRRRRRCAPLGRAARDLRPQSDRRLRRGRHPRGHSQRDQMARRGRQRAEPPPAALPPLPRERAVPLRSLARLGADDGGRLLPDRGVARPPEDLPQGLTRSALAGLLELGEDCERIVEGRSPRLRPLFGGGSLPRGPPRCRGRRSAALRPFRGRPWPLRPRPLLRRAA